MQRDSKFVFSPSYRELLGYDEEEDELQKYSKVSTVGIMGHGAIGKTTLCKAILGEDVEHFHPSTAGIEFHNWVIGDHLIKFADFGGQDIWSDIVKEFMVQLLKAKLILLVFDASTPSNFRKTVRDFHRWIDYLEEGGRNITLVRPVLFIGSKIDEDNPRLIARGGMSKNAIMYRNSLRDIVERVASPNQTQTLRLLHDEYTAGKRLEKNVLFVSGLYYDKNDDYRQRMERLRSEIKWAVGIR